MSGLPAKSRYRTAVVLFLFRILDVVLARDSDENVPVNKQMNVQIKLVPLY